MPIDPQVLSQLLQQSQGQPDQPNLGQMPPQQAPAPPDDSGQPKTLQSMVQSGVADEPSPSKKLLLGKPSEDNTPESFSDTTLRGMIQPQATQIPAFKDTTSPARNLLANMFLGMGASLTGQKFQSIQEQKYQRYVENLKLQQEQQLRNQQLQIGMANVYQKALKDRNNLAFKQSVQQIKNEKDATTQQFLINKWEAQHQLDWAKYNQQNDRFEALQKHMNNQDEQAKENADPKIKDPDYLRAVAMVTSQYDKAGQDYNDADIKPKFLQNVEDLTMAIKAREAQMRAQSSQKPPQAQMIGPDGKAFLVTPGTQIPPGSRTITGESQMNMPTTATRRAGEQGGIIQTAGEHLIDVLDKNRDAIGNFESYWKKAKNGTPAADPTTSYINGLLQSYIALQPALHGFRSTQAMEHFEKAIGGTPKNVDALIAAIRATNETGGIVNQIGKGQKVSNNGPIVGTIDGGYRFKGGDPKSPLSWEKVK